MAEAMKSNYSLSVLDIAGNGVPDEIFNSIEIAILRNRDNSTFREQQQMKSRLLEEELHAVKRSHDEYIVNVRTDLDRSLSEYQVCSRYISIS